MRRRLKSFIVPIAAAASTLVPGLSAPVRAELQPYSYHAVIDSVDDSANTLQGLVAPGGSLDLTAWFEPGAADGNPDPNWGLFGSSGSTSDPRLVVEFPSFTLSSPSATAVVVNDLEVPEPNPPMLDYFRLESFFDTIALGRHIGFFAQLLLIDGAAAVFDTDAMPGATPDAAFFSTARQLIITGSPIGGSEQFTIFATVSVPTPGALALCAIACAPLLRRPRRGIS
jgi:hypothetical protein